MNSIVKALDLTKQYANILAVDHLELEVFEGEIFGLQALTVQGNYDYPYADWTISTYVRVRHHS